jgi:HAD superfamily hydrolase (TIGR01509 family)
MNKYDLIIFDCDGTLVDSETLNNEVAACVLTDYGLEGYSLETCLRDFAGRSWTEIKKIVDARHHIDLPRSVIQNYIDTVQARMEKELQAVEGALDFVASASQKYKICVASNGERGNVVKSLQLTGYDAYFPDNITFTKIQVANAKPAPDLFLFAADKMDVAPARCLVIEDSVSGVKGAVAAGMDVIGFTGVAHDKKAADKALTNAGTMANFDRFIHIASTIGL